MARFFVQRFYAIYRYAQEFICIIIVMFACFTRAAMHSRGQHEVELHVYVRHVYYVCVYTHIVCIITMIFIYLFRPFLRLLLACLLGQVSSLGS